MSKPQMTTDTIDNDLAEIRSRPQKLRASLLATATATQAALDAQLADLATARAEEITSAHQANELAKGAASLIDKNTHYYECLAVEKHVATNAAAIAEVLFGKLKSVLAPEPTVRERIAAVAAGLTEKLRSAVGLEREIAAKEREAAESFAPAIAAYSEAAKRKIDIFIQEPNFEHFTDACGKIEELKNLISEAAELK